MARGGVNIGNAAAALLFLVDDKGTVRRTTGDMGKFTTSAHNAGRATEHFERTTKNLTNSLGLLGGYFGIRQLVEYADTWTLLSARIGAVTNSTEQMMSAQMRVSEIALSSRNSLAAVGVLYTRLALSSKELERSHNDLLNVVSAVSHSMLITGATGVEAAQSMRQLAQAFSKGKLDGDEFRTVMEAMPLVAQTIADSFGITREELYKFSEQGKLGVNEIIKALLDAQEELEEMAKTMPWTIGQSFEYLQTSIVRLIGILNSATFAGGMFGQAVRLAADNIDKIVAAIGAWTGALILYKAALVAAWTWTQLMTAAKAVKMWFELAKMIRSTADAMYLLSTAAKGIAGLVLGLLAAGVGFLAYKKLVEEINEETQKWIEANANLDEILGETPAKAEEEKILKARLKIIDMLREAQQEVLLASFDDRAADRLGLHFDAINKKIEARREYEGDILVQMEAAIDQERDLLLVAEAVSAAYDERKEALEEQARIAEQLAENIQKAFGDVFYEIARTGIANFKDLFDGIKLMFFRMLADMLAAKMMQELGGRIQEILGLKTNDALTTAEIDTLIQGAINRGLSQAKETIGGPLTPEQMDQATEGITAIEIEDIVVTAEAKKNLGAVFAELLGSALAGFSIGQAIGKATGDSTFSAATGAFGGAAAGFMIGGVPGAAFGALAGMMGGLMGATEAQTEQARLLAEQQHLLYEATVENSKRIVELTAQFNTPQVGVIYDAMREATRRQIDKGSTGSGLNDPVDWYLITQAAEEFGITLFTEAGYVEGSLEALEIAIQLSIDAITKFGHNLTDITKRQEAYNKIFDVEMTPQQALNDTYDVLMQMAPELMKQLGLANLDLNTPEARATLEQGLKDIFELIDAGLLTPEQLGFFGDKNQLLDWILKVKDGLVEFHAELMNVVTDFPRAMDIAYYEEKYGRYDTRSGYNPEEQTINVEDTIITEHAPEGWTIYGGITINSYGNETGEELLARLEAAVEDRLSRGGTTALTEEEEAF